MEHLPDDLLQHEDQDRVNTSFSAYTVEDSHDYSLKSGLQMIEKKRIQQAVWDANGNKTKAMKALGISRRTFYKKWKQYGFDEEE